MSKNTKGSCLLLLTLITSVILIFAINSWQTILLNSELVSKKYNYEFNFRVLEGLHNFGIFKCINNYRKILKKNSNNGTIQSIVLYNDPWPIESAVPAIAASDGWDSEAIKITNIAQYHSIIKLTVHKDFSIINSRLINSKTGESYFMESKLKKLISDEGDNSQTTRFTLYDWQF